MRDRSATARLARDEKERQVESAQMRKLELGAADTWRWLSVSFRDALEAGRFDGHMAYLAANLKRHVEACCDAVAHAIGNDAPRLVSTRRRLFARLQAVAEIAERVDDAVTAAISIGAELGDLERVVLSRMLDTIDAELTRARDQDLDILMRQHWVDVGGSG